MNDSNTSEDVLQNIRNYVEKARKQQEDAMDVEEPDAHAIEARLSSTITALETRLEQRRVELERLREKIANPVSTAPALDPRERLKQLRTITKAYDLMTPEQPDLPSPTSALQPLLAARTIQKTTKDTKTNIATTQSTLDSATQQLASEDAQLSDSKALHEALQGRTARLQQTQRENLTKTDTEKAKELLKAKTKRKQHFERDTAKLQKVLDEFIEEHLAAMLAAEEIGGPVVGDLVDVDEDMLSAGFSAQGKPKSTSKAVPEDKRQRRIDDIWGAGQEGEGHETEKDAAAEEVKALLDELITSGGYVQLPRDSAVARFLVRAKVAQFDPKSAARLRLIDFARELDE